MKIEKKPLVLHEFSGTWKEIGRQYGEDCRDEIKNMMGYWEKALHPIMPDKTMDEIIAATKVFEQPIRDYAPEIMEEIEGIAEGANISLGEALFHQGSFEMDVAGPLYIGGCTSFACSGKATKDGKTIAGQHFDWYDDADMILMRVKPNKGPAMLGTSIAGQVMQFGINSNGIGHYANVLAYPKSVVGVPAVVVAQKGLQSKNVPDVIRCITQAPNAIALNHMIAGKDGEMVDVEATPDKCGVLLPDCGCDILTHANNFLCHYLQESCMGGLTSETADDGSFRRAGCKPDDGTDAGSSLLSRFHLPSLRPDRPRIRAVLHPDFPYLPAWGRQTVGHQRLPLREPLLSLYSVKDQIKPNSRKERHAPLLPLH